MASVPTRRWLLGLALAALALGCAKTYPPPAIERTPAGFAEATKILMEAADRRRDIRLSEGGLSIRAYGYGWEEEDQALAENQQQRELDALDRRGGGQVGSLGRSVRTEGRRVRVTLDNLEAVRVRKYPLGAALEFDLKGEPNPVYLEVKNGKEAERLGGAIDLMRRARTPAAGKP